MSTSTYSGQDGKCQYASSLGGACPLHAIGEDEKGMPRCFFHLEKGKGEPREFWQHLASYLSACHDVAATKETSAYRDQSEHWFRREANDGLVAQYSSDIRQRRDKPWYFCSFTFPAMDHEENGHNFRHSVFPAVDFTCATFDGDADFFDAAFHGEARFTGATFADKSATTYFSKARFPAGADFLGATFRADADFRFAEFNGEKAKADFRTATFVGKADFSDETDDGAKTAAANFSGATFGGKADFSHREFGDVVLFAGTTFNGDACFEESRFRGEASFRDATFGDKALFFKAHVDKDLDFSYAHVKRRLHFGGAQIGPKAEVRLWGLNLGQGTKDAPAGEVIFRDLPDASAGGMSRVSFLHTVIYEDRPCFRFENVGWQKDPESMLYDAPLALHRMEDWPKQHVTDERKKHLYDLFNIKAEPRPDERPEQRSALAEESLYNLVQRDVERAARELKRHYEDFGSYPDAGNFHIAEMTYRRAQSRGFFRFALCFYRFMSTYGESPRLALARLGGVWLFFGNLYYWFGFGRGSLPLWQTWADEPTWRGLERAGWALLFGLVNMVPGYFRFQTEPLDCWYVALMMAAQALLGVGVLALFLLAIRRRFRR